MILMEIALAFLILALSFLIFIFGVMELLKTARGHEVFFEIKPRKTSHKSEDQK